MKPAAECKLACEFGQVLNAKDCKCEPIKTIPVEGHLFMANKWDGQAMTIDMKVGGKVTFQEWSLKKDGVFVWPIDPVKMLEKATCIKLSGTPHRDDVYQQFSLEAITADCKWSLKVENAEKKTLDITFAVAGDVTNDVTVITFSAEKPSWDVTIGMMYATYVPEGWSVVGLKQEKNESGK
jgi:hypothetical protein